MQDFEFDIAKQSGLNSKNSLLHKILIYVEKAIEQCRYRKHNKPRDERDSKTEI